LTLRKKSSVKCKETFIERISFEGIKESKSLRINVIIRKSEKEGLEEARETEFTAKKENADQSQRSFTANRSAFKLNKSSQSQNYLSTNFGSNFKDVRQKLDFSKAAPVQRGIFSSDKKNAFDDNYISTRFTLKGMNYCDIQHEMEKINQVIFSLVSFVAEVKHLWRNSSRGSQGRS
jgi:hypothetical protein